MSSSKIGVVLVGHGSRALGFDTAMQKVATALRREKKYIAVLCGFLEVTPPSIHEAILACVHHGAGEVRVLPYFVLTGRHVTRDIPRIVGATSKKYRGQFKIVLCPYLGFHPKLVAVVKERLLHGR